MRTTALKWCVLEMMGLIVCQCSNAGDLSSAPTGATTGIEGSARGSFEETLTEARVSMNKVARRRFISAAVEGARDQERTWLTEDRARALASFDEDDFTEETRGQIVSALGHEDIATASHICLWGIVGDGETNATVRMLADQWRQEWPRWRVEREAWELTSTCRNWYAVLALARQGERWAIDGVIEMADRPDLLAVERAQLFWRVAWIRQPEAVEFLKKHINSDELVGDPVTDADIACPMWLLAAEAVAACIVDFPYSELDEERAIYRNRDGVRRFMNSHKGPWRIKGRPWPPKEAARSGPGPVLPPSAAGSGSYATNGPSESTAKGSPPASGSSPGHEGAKTAKVVAAVACGLIALTAVGVLLRRRRDRGASGG